MTDYVWRCARCSGCEKLDGPCFVMASDAGDRPDGLEQPRLCPWGGDADWELVDSDSTVASDTTDSVTD